MDFKTFSEANRQRCESPNGFNHPLHGGSPSDWMTATMGELGEAANIVKKLNRIRDGIVNKEPEEELRAELAKELADTFCYLDLMAQAAGVDLEAAVIDKFNEVSRRVGSSIRLPDGTRCDHCGMDDWFASRHGRTDCAPPFVRQPHSFTGAHPSHQRS